MNWKFQQGIIFANLTEQHSRAQQIYSISMCCNDEPCHKQSFMEKCIRIINIAPKCALVNWLSDCLTDWLTDWRSNNNNKNRLWNSTAEENINGKFQLKNFHLKL